MLQLIASEMSVYTLELSADERPWIGKREPELSIQPRENQGKYGLCYSRLCLETPVLRHIIGRNVALQLLT